MDLLELFDQALEKYDLLTILIVGALYLWFRKKLDTMDKRVQSVDHAVNNRPPGTPTLSQEISEIHRKVDVTSTKIEYIEKEIEEHRRVDEVTFKLLTDDISELRKKIS